MRLRICDMIPANLAVLFVVACDRKGAVGQHKQGIAGMAERHLESEQSREISKTLETALQNLDAAGLHLPAIHVHNALLALGQERTCRSVRFVASDVG